VEFIIIHVNEYVIQIFASILSYRDRKAKCTVLVIQLFIQKCVQPHGNRTNVLPHMNLYVSMRHELSFHFALRDLRTSFVQKQTLYIKVHEQLQSATVHPHDL